MSRRGIVRPLWVATMQAGAKVRFFRSPKPGADLPWHAPDDLMKAIHVPHETREAIRIGMACRFRGTVQTVAAETGPLTIAPFWCGTGLINACITRHPNSTAHRMNKEAWEAALREAVAARMAGMTLQDRLSYIGNVDLDWPQSGLPWDDIA